MTDADSFLMTLLNTGEELVLDVVGQLQTDRVVIVGELVADVARVGPRGLGLGLGQARRWGVVGGGGGGGGGESPQRDVGRKTRPA